MELKNLQKSPKKFLCEKCDFTCSRLSEWNVHILRPKHLNGNFGNQKNLQTEKKKCDCGRQFMTQSGLWKHKKICQNKKQDILTIFKQNQEFKDLIIEQNKQILEQNKQLFELVKEKQITVNSNHTTNNFNLQIFLNEKCKDALNIMDFVSSLKLQLTDLESMGKLGYSEGISKIFIRGLKELDIFKRPIHCSDVKRDTLYIKDKDAWEKENENKDKMKLAIDYIANENIKQISTWVVENPQANDYESKKHSEYIKILGESMGGGYEEDTIKKNYQKIIKNVAKEVVIDKI